ncbi:Methionyl-tRNA formyltransferase [Morella rubra]|uniref:Methionyl-tRNA formyltransferase, mitochondrial n=1 Tax=Morella rubra TaxID=262757 RepID=A0A6A1VEI6_9ROSI|nr:Methionyl-tRNA formyltransferase [Morella rubra]
MNSSLTLCRLCCFQASTFSSCSSSLSVCSKKKPLVFLGSPQVAATVLDSLLSTSSAPDSLFEVAAIVTQPPSRRNRGRNMMPSPVAQYALDRGFSSDLIFTPERAGEDMFLSNLKALQPELCITAAYGNILPSKFLKIPPLGTVNIHPSLLPLYRGAAPVQRALQDGVKETGVSLAFTVRTLDAGPVITCERLEVDDQIKLLLANLRVLCSQAPDLLELLFSEGSKLLIRELPSIFDGSARVKAQLQDDSKATLAPKITPEESWLSFDEEALVLHNKVRAFAGWPGTRAKILVVDKKDGQHKILELKIITTRVCSHNTIAGNGVDEITFAKGALAFPCGGCTALEVLEVQLPGKKVVSATAFWNGLRGYIVIIGHDLLVFSNICLMDESCQLWSIVGLIQHLVYIDSDGSILSIRIRQSPGTNPLKGEARAVRLACDLAADYEGRSIMLEGNSLEVIRQIKDQQATPDWLIEGEITTVRQLLSRHNLWQLNWLPRTANMLAHNVAKWGLLSGSIGDFLSMDVPLALLTCKDFE